jgi:enolase
MDVAASEFLTKDGKYDLDFKSPNNDGKMVQTGPELAATFIDLCKKYPIVSVEDPFDQDDWGKHAAPFIAVVLFLAFLHCATRRSYF